MLALVICGVVMFYANSVEAQQQKSRRIEVYVLSQNYWDTKYGDTLDEIVMQLLPNNPSKREALKQDIIQLNPDAFINNDPAQLLANKRLWMPGYMKQADSRVDPETTIVERYSWGNIKRPKEKKSTDERR
ncbi:MAG: hypothetical protein LJE83_05950 [Gammaproteobacteria bacterium]|nr:hypothetical protein [Gammaproteobacteria bacterium]